MKNFSRTLVIYYSRSGNTRKLAESIAKKLKSDIEVIRPAPARYEGVAGYLRALRDALGGRQIEIEPIQKNLGNYDLILLGGPIWGSQAAAPVQEFLKRYQQDLGDVAFFLTQGGRRGGRKVLNQMEVLAKRTPLKTLVLSESELKSFDFESWVNGFVAPFKETVSVIQTVSRRADEKRASPSP